MSTIVACPACKRTLNVPEDVLGFAVRCPDCGGTFDAGPGGALLPAGTLGAAQAAEDAEAPTPPGAPPGAITAAPPGPGAAAADANDGKRPCPYCGERVDAMAVHCAFCGEDLAEQVSRPWERPYRPLVRRDCEPHRGTLVLVFGILSLAVGLIGLPFGIAAWVMGHRDLKKMSERAMDPQGRGVTTAGWVCGIVGTLFQAVMVVFMVGYFVVLFGFIMPAAIRSSRPATPVVTPAAPPPAMPVQQPPPIEAR